MVQLISQQTWLVVLVCLALAAGSVDVPQGIQEVPEGIQEVPEGVQEVSEGVPEVPDVLYLVLSQPGEHHAVIANLTAEAIRLVQISKIP